MSDEKARIEKLENEFPLLAGPAFAEARRRVLASGQSVLQSKDGFIYRVYPDGRKDLVKQIEPPTSVIPRPKWLPPNHLQTFIKEGYPQNSGMWLVNRDVGFFALF